MTRRWEAGGIVAYSKAVVACSIAACCLGWPVKFGGQFEPRLNFGI